MYMHVTFTAAENIHEAFSRNKQNVNSADILHL